MMFPDIKDIDSMEQKILQFLAIHPNCSQEDIANAFNISTADITFSWAFHFLAFSHHLIYGSLYSDIKTRKIFINWCLTNS